MTPAKTKIVNRTAPVLRKTAKPVPLDAIGSKKIGDVISRMKAALKAQEDGVAIAAPQIGESLRIFVVSGKVLNKKNKKASEEVKEPKDLVFINPEFTKVSKTKKMMEEGCLSVRWLYGWVERSEKATVKAYDENGKRFEKGGSGLMAQIFQHEMDHLDGILFIDKAKNLRALPPEPKPDESR